MLVEVGVFWWDLFVSYPPGNDHISLPTFEDDVPFPKPSGESFGMHGLVWQRHSSHISISQS